MTKRTTLATIGPCVDVIKIEAEILDTPVTYSLDCQQCGWGLFAPTDLEFTIVTAQQHLDNNHEDPA